MQTLGSDINQNVHCNLMQTFQLISYVSKARLEQTFAYVLHISCGLRLADEL